MGNPEEIRRVRADSDLLFAEQAVGQAFDRLAKDVTARLGERDPVLLCVLTGGIYTSAELMRRLDFPLTCDVIHASRYRGETSGSEIEWISLPRTALRERTVLIVDDILDQGITLEAIAGYCREQGASVYTAVLVEKMLENDKAIQADFVGLQAENRYLFGCGMDYKGYWRNLPGIYAVRGL